MLRTALALALSFSVSAPAFAQTPQDRVVDSVTKIKEYITAYDSGTGTTLARIGGKTLLYSFAAYGVASAATAPIEAGDIARRTFSDYKNWYRLSTNTHGYKVAKVVKDSAGLAFVAGGTVLVGAAAVTFLAQHIWYGWLGHADQNAALTAEQKEMVSFFSQPAEEIIAQAKMDPALAAGLNELADSIHITK